MSSSNSLRVLVAVTAAVATSAALAEDLSALHVDAQRGQSADQARRDRYECHNWAVEQTGQTPAAAPAPREQANDAKREKRAERVDRAIVGAAIGSVIGGLTHSSRHHRRDGGDAVLTGAAVGAAVGAATAGKAKSEPEEAAPVSDYLRALTACLEGRGYTVTMSGAAGKDR
jgi:uncharacterized protein YcfJ